MNIPVPEIQKKITELKDQGIKILRKEIKTNDVQTEKDFLVEKNPFAGSAEQKAADEFKKISNVVVSDEEAKNKIEEFINTKKIK